MQLKIKGPCMKSAMQTLKEEDFYTFLAGLNIKLYIAKKKNSNLEKDHKMITHE
jgi:hypothetical protein